MFVCQLDCRGHMTIEQQLIKIYQCAIISNCNYFLKNNNLAIWDGPSPSSELYKKPPRGDAHRAASSCPSLFTFDDSLELSCQLNFCAQSIQWNFEFEFLLWFCSPFISPTQEKIPCKEGRGELMPDLLARKQAFNASTSNFLKFWTRSD